MEITFFGVWVVFCAFYACTFYAQVIIERKAIGHIFWGLMYNSALLSTVVFNFFFGSNWKYEMLFVGYILFLSCMGLNLLIRGIDLWREERRRSVYE
jgi:hypothetical protein